MALINTLKKYGKTCLITGASSGIGLEYAKKFAELGHDLIIVARSENKLKDLATELESKYSIKVTTIGQDLAQPQSARELINKVEELKLEVNILINNAGFATLGPILDSELKSQLEMVDLNCRTPLELSWHFGNKMAEKGSGAIIWLASVVSYMPIPNMAVYGATKAFNLLVGEAMAAELKARGVDVLAVSPGSTRTNFTDRANFNDKVNKMPARTAMQVVDTTLAGLNSKFSTIDGPMNACMIFGLRFVPRSLQAKFMKTLYKGFMN